MKLTQPLHYEFKQPDTRKTSVSPLPAHFRHPIENGFLHNWPEITSSGQLFHIGVLKSSILFFSVHHTSCTLKVTSNMVSILVHIKGHQRYWYYLKHKTPTGAAWCRKMAAVSTAGSVTGATRKARHFLPAHIKPSDKSEQKVKQKLTPRPNSLQMCLHIQPVCAYKRS